MRHFFAVPALLLVLLAGGCTDAKWAKHASLGNRFRVTLFSGGQAVRTFTSTGKVETEAESDGWFFMDEVTRRLVRISGSVVVEQLD